MYQFTETTIINDALDYTTQLPRWDYANDTFRIKRVGNFKKANVVRINKRAYSAPVLGKVILDMSSITAASGIFSLLIYIKLANSSQNSLYANPFVYKGKPFVIQFEKKTGDTNAQIAQRLVNNINKYINIYDMKWMLPKVVGGKVEITTTDEFQIFTQAEVSEYSDTAGPMSAGGVELGGFVPIFSAKRLSDPDYDNKNLIILGKEGFGNYKFLMHNFRLPTYENIRWDGPLKDEAPIITGKYNEYIIEYSVNRGLMGGAAIGQQVTSNTTHVFYVNQDVASDFEVQLNKLKTIEVVAEPLTISASTPAQVVAAGAPATINVTATGGTVDTVAASTDATWITVASTTTSTAVLTVAANTGTARSAVVKLTVTSTTGATEVTEVTISQAAA